MEKTEFKVQTAHRPVLSKLDSFADFFAEGEKQVHGTSTRFFFLEEEGLAEFSSGPHWVLSRLCLLDT